MTRLLKALGLMTVAEHERLMDAYREDWKFVADQCLTQRDTWEAKFKKAITDLAAAREEVEALIAAGTDVIEQATDYYTARNNRRMSIEGEDGEKCWIVPFDPFEHLRATVNKMDRERRKGVAS